MQLSEENNINDSSQNTELIINLENPVPYGAAFKKTIRDLSNGILNIYQPDLQKLEAQLSELTTKQKVLVEQLHNENLKVSWSQNSSDFIDIFTKIGVYRDKLITIKKDMLVLHERSAKLKKRAIRLQQFKAREDAAKEQQRQKELELIPK